jgi:peptidoglycan/LPS O-acetylase OafA/YrhL
MKVQRHFEALDGLRGVAAVCVLLCHAALRNFSTRVFERGYLAVDLFFMLSAFVLAYSQDQLLRQGLGAGGFMTKRLIRLYPVILISALLGVIAALVAGFTPRLTALALVAQLLLIPFVTSADNMFALNGAQWSLVYELLANLVHAVSFRFQTTRRLAAFVGISAMGLIVASFTYGSLGVGWAMSNWLGGLARVCFGYSTGLLIFRLHAAGHLPHWKLPGLLALIALPVIVFLPTGHARTVTAARDVLTVLFVFPALLTAAINVTFSAAERAVAGFLATASYPVYCLYGAFKWLLASLVAHHLHTLGPRLLLWGGYIVFMLALGFCVARWIEAPAQRYLKAALRKSGAVAALS